MAILQLSETEQCQLSDIEGIGSRTTMAANCMS